MSENRAVNITLFIILFSLLLTSIFGLIGIGSGTLSVPDWNTIHTSHIPILGDVVDGAKYIASWIVFLGQIQAYMLSIVPLNYIVGFIYAVGVVSVIIVFLGR